MVHALETTYQGRRYRSRTEARWGVFFDRLGIANAYEPEGFALSRAGLWYLPDFYLSAPYYTWVEIKGPDPTATERRKLAALARAGERGDLNRRTDATWLLAGSPYANVVERVARYRVWLPLLHQDGRAVWTYGLLALCRQCGRLVVQGIANYLPGYDKRHGWRGTCHHADAGDAMAARLLRAYTAATSERFGT